jgi:hypothetical protein
MRTKGVKERSLELCRGDGSVDLSRLWNVLIHMFASNIASSLYVERQRRKLVLIRNETDVPFVTGDQPVINLKADPPSPPTELALYYPIAPHLALLLCEVDEQPIFPADGLTFEQAATLNAKLARECYRQVFAQSKSSLQALAAPVAP